MKPELQQSERKLPGLDPTATRRAQEIRTGRNVALTVTAVFTAVSAVLAASNTECEKEEKPEQPVDCQSIVDCIDHLIQMPNGAFELEPPADETYVDSDGCAALTPEEQEQSPFCN